MIIGLTENWPHPVTPPGDNIDDIGNSNILDADLALSDDENDGKIW